MKEEVMPWMEVKVKDQRKQFVEELEENLFSFADLCRKYEISRKTGYKWKDRFKIEGLAGLVDKSKRPLHNPRSVDDDISDQIISMRCEYPRLGPRKILAKLRKAQPMISWPSASTIGNILDRNNLILPRYVRRRVPAQTMPLSHSQACNDVWTMDFKGSFRTGDGKKCEPFTVVESFSRYLLHCAVLKRNNTEYVWEVLRILFLEYGLPRYLRSDNGPPFGSTGVGRLTRMSLRVIKAGVIPEWITPGKPQENGRHERMHLTLKNETAKPPAHSFAAQLDRLEAFKRYYNKERPHEAIGQVPPETIYSSSERSWDGKLRSPEYASDYKKKKVRSCGKISWKGQDVYIGRVLENEWVGLMENEEGWEVVYGPILLGHINANNQFKRPKRQFKKKTGLER